MSSIPRVFFTSDPHFYHKRVIEYSKRPFSSVEDMNEKLIERWNSKVRPKDPVWLLGDVIFGGASKLAPIAERLNGEIHVVLGNHDPFRLMANTFTSVQFYKELRFENQHLVLMHYPIESWNSMHHGSIHLHGHTHGNSKLTYNRMDVGLDANNWYPVSLEEVLEKISEQNKLVVPDPNNPDYHQYKE